MRPHRNPPKMPDADDVIVYLLSLVYDSMVGAFAITQLACILVIGLYVIGMVIFTLVSIIIFIKDVVKALYDRSDDCEDIRQGLIENNGYHLIQVDQESLDDDGRAILEKENGITSVDLNKKGYSVKHYGVPKDNGQHTVKEDKESSDEEGRKSLGEEYDKSSVDLNKCYLQVQ